MSFVKIVSLSLSAILVENFIFVRFLGICPFLGVSKKTDTAVGMSLSVIFVMTVSSAATYIVNRFVLVPFDLGYMRTVAFILIIASLVQFVELFLMKSVPALFHALGIYLPLITTNCAVLGVALLNVKKELDFLGSVINGFMSGVGFAIAMIIFSSIREHLEESDHPKAFEGFPIALISASLLSLAFMGFQGLSIFN
ncbi:MAG: electron transport complex subunit RsxA [Clostridia bacterium]|nr:electron transport complex subunit RsxA [Clostridia bacterium]